MAFPLLRIQESASLPVIFGKLPNRPDFLRVNATHPVACELDEIIQGALAQVSAQEGWEAVYDLAPKLDICHLTEDGKWLFLGALLPSRDQSGRRFPLIAGVALPAQAMAGNLGLMPIACEVFFEGLQEHLLNAVENSVEALACRQFMESQVRAWTSKGSDFSLAWEIVAHFLEGQSPSTLETSLVEANPRATLRQALTNLLFYRDYLRRFRAPSALQLVHLPLRVGRGETALHASAWLTVLAALSGDGEGWRASYFISHHPGRAALYTAFGTSSIKLIASALGENVKEESRLDLWSEQKAWQSHRLYAETAYALDCLLADPSLHLSQLRGFLMGVGEKIAITGI